MLSISYSLYSVNLSLSLSLSLSPFYCVMQVDSPDKHSESVSTV